MAEVGVQLVEVSNSRDGCRPLTLKVLNSLLDSWFLGRCSVKLVDKIKALDMLFKHLGLYQPLPPLEIVLELLPTTLAKAVRAALSQPAGK